MVLITQSAPADGPSYELTPSHLPADTKYKTHIQKRSPTCGLGVEEVAGVGAPCVHLARLPGHHPISQRLLHRLLHLDRTELKRCMAEGGWVVLPTSERKRKELPRANNVWVTCSSDPGCLRWCDATQGEA